MNRSVHAKARTLLCFGLLFYCFDRFKQSLSDARHAQIARVDADALVLELPQGHGRLVVLDVADVAEGVALFHGDLSDHGILGVILPKIVGDNDLGVWITHKKDCNFDTKLQSFLTKSAFVGINPLRG